MVSIAVIGGEGSGRSSLAAKLGKKGNISDITLYDFEKGDQILTLIDPSGYPASVKPLMTALAMSEMVLLCIPPSGMDASAGQCMIAVDLLGIEHGIIVQTMSDTSNPIQMQENAGNIRTILKGTVAQDWDIMPISTTTFEGMEQLKEAVNDLDREIADKNRSKADLSPRVMVDHSFNVKGIGSVILGRVIRGTIYKHDKLTIFPINREIEIRNIQMHDHDKKSAPPGSRVGLALKGVQAKEVERGHVISSGETNAKEIELECLISKFSQGLTVNTALHLYVNLQSTPVRITYITIDGQAIENAPPGSECRVKVDAGEDVAFSEEDVFILADLNNPKQHLIAGCRMTG